MKKHDKSHIKLVFNISLSFHNVFSFYTDLYHILFTNKHLTLLKHFFL